jgi:branched-subunit amino acid aminotransferase/4-amino-4-deoxychorismate lyase
MLNNRGQVACAAAANLFWIEDGRVFTPALECGVLAGIARARLLSATEVAEAVADRARLEAADAVFLTNSLIGVRPVSRLGERAFEPHPLAAWLSELFSSPA